jgi:hypothetical protein
MSESPRFAESGGYCPEADPCPECGQAPHRSDCGILLKSLKRAPPKPRRTREQRLAEERDG